VVDLWGGHADSARTRPWERDTIVNVFSTSKAMTALCALILVDRGQLDLDAPVARYWPEFAVAGKERITTRHLLTHSAGLAAIRQPLPTAALYDWHRMTAALAAEAPWWEPGSASGYHALTYGYLVGEVVRRITGTTLGAFFREEVAARLPADFHIGLAPSEDARVAEMVPATAEETAAAGPAAVVDPESLFGRVLGNPPMRAEFANQPAWRRAEIPAANGHGNARSVARVMAILARRSWRTPSPSNVTPGISSSPSPCAGGWASCSPAPRSPWGRTRGPSVTAAGAARSVSPTWTPA